MGNYRQNLCWITSLNIKYEPNDRENFPLQGIEFKRQI